MTEEQTTQAAPRAARSRAPRNIARPPYTAASDIDALFDRIQRIAPPGKVDEAWARGFSLSPRVVDVLEWLGVVKADGTVDTDRWNSVRILTTRKAALEERVRSSYAPIFDQVDVAEASRDDLDGAFVVKYGLGDSRRYVKAFTTLCGHAGIATSTPARRGDDGGDPAGARPAPRPTPRSTGTGTAKATPPRASGTGAAAEGDRTPAPQTPRASGGMTANIEIPADWGEDQIRARLALVKRLIAETDG